MSGTPVLATQGLTRRFGGLVAVNDVTMSVPQGQTLGVIGPNGSGKSTFINLVTGHLRPTKGSVLIDGKDLTDAKPWVIAGARVARTFQIVKPFRGMSVRENVAVGILYGPEGTGRMAPALRAADEVLGEDLVGLFEPRRHPPGSFWSVKDPDRDVFADRHAAEGLDDLEGPRDPGFGDHPWLGTGEVTTVDQDGPRGGLEMPGDEVDEGALAGPVGADDTEGEALGDDEAHVVDGLEATETNPQTPGLQDGHGAHSRYLRTLASNE